MHDLSNTQSPPTARALAVLEALAEDSGSGLSSSEIARRVGLSTSTTASILATMDEAGYVERLPSRAYQLGPGPLKLLAALRNRYPLLGAADDELARLAATAGCGATLARIGADDAEVILTAGTVAEFQTPVGHRMLLSPPYGSVAVAWQQPHSIDGWLSSAAETLTGERLEKLRATLAGIRERGYAVYSVARDAQEMVSQIRDLLGRVDDHVPADVLRQVLATPVAGVKIYSTAELANPRRRPVSYVIAPVFGPDQQPRYLVTLHIMRESVSADELNHYIDALLDSAKTLSGVAGGHWPAAGDN